MPGPPSLQSAITKYSDVSDQSKSLKLYIVEASQRETPTNVPCGQHRCEDT